MLTNKCENKSNKTTERLCCFLFFILLYIICGYARIYVCTQGVQARVYKKITVQSFSHFASEWTQAAKLARQTQLPAESPHLTCTVFLLSENIITKREVKLNLIHFTIFDI